MQAAQAQAAQMGASGQVRAQEPMSLVLGKRMPEVSMERALWGLSEQQSAIGHLLVRGIWASMLNLLCLESEAGFR